MVGSIEVERTEPKAAICKLICLALAGKSHISTSTFAKRPKKLGYMGGHWVGPFFTTTSPLYLVGMVIGLILIGYPQKLPTMSTGALVLILP